MKGFADFFVESFEHEGEPLDNKWSSHTLRHVATIGKNHVQLDFHHNHTSPGHYEADLLINGYGSKTLGDGRPATRDDDSSVKIGLHTKKVMSDFIRAYRPKSIGMLPSDMNRSLENKKKTLYHQVAAHLAKKHGGEVKEPLPFSDALGGGYSTRATVQFNDFHDRYKYE